MLNFPSKRELHQLPKFDDLPVCFTDFDVFMHFSAGQYHWYAAAYEDGVFYGFTVVECEDHVEWGFFELAELEELYVPMVMDMGDGRLGPVALCEVERDSY